MEIIKTPTYIKLTEEERKILNDAYVILEELYEIINENDYEFVDDTCGNSYNRYVIALAANVLQMVSPAEKMELSN